MKVGWERLAFDRTNVDWAMKTGRAARVVALDNHIAVRLIALRHGAVLPVLESHSTGYLGHRSINSTTRYAALAPGRFKNIWGKG
jgi:hypothetical protein